MNVRTFVACETDKADLPCLLCLKNGFHRSAFGKNAVRVGVANDFVELQKIDPVGLKAAQRIVDLTCRGGFGAPIDLGHEKRFLPIAVAQRVAHADLTLAAIVVPTVVEEIDPFIQACAHNANAFLSIRLLAKMIAAQSTSET